MSFWKKVANIGAGILEECASSCVNYVKDSNKVASQYESRLKNVDRNSLSAQGKAKYDRISNQINKSRNLDINDYKQRGDKYKDLASSLRQWSEKDD
jgi:hypothetical protein